MKRNKSHNIKTHVNDETDVKTRFLCNAFVVMLWSGFILTMVPAIYSIYSILHKFGII